MYCLHISFVYKYIYMYILIVITIVWFFFPSYSVTIDFISFFLFFVLLFQLLLITYNIFFLFYTFTFNWWMKKNGNFSIWICVGCIEHVVLNMLMFDLVVEHLDIETLAVLVLLTMTISKFQCCIVKYVVADEDPEEDR